MNIKSINEAFERHANECQDQSLKESSENIIDELRRALYNKCSDLQRANNYNLKAYEIAFQDIIEEFFPDYSWWEVCDLDIFTDLFANRNPFDTVENICDNIKPEFNEVVNPATSVEEDFENTESLIETLEEVLNRMNEAEMSDEDRHDSDLIRSMIQKMQARSNAAFTPEEKAVMQKYGIERNNWKKKLTVDGRELNPNLDDANRTYYYRKGGYSNGTPSKINYADRARKLPGRKKNQIAGDGSSTFIQNADYNAHGIGRNIQHVERNIADDRMQEPLRDMQHALNDRKYAQSRIDNADEERAKRMQAAQAAYDKAKERADRHYEMDTVDSEASRNRAQSRIDKLLKRESLKNKSKKHLKESWTDAYNEFIKISDRYLPDTDTIEEKVSELYDKHRGESDWDQAFSKWEEETYKYLSDEYCVSDNESGRMYKGLNKALNAAAQFLQYSDDVIIQRATE
jgi:hypothetical protein